MIQLLGDLTKTQAQVQTQTFINENICFPKQVLFLFNKILRKSLRQFNFMVTFFGKPLEGKRWGSSTKLGSLGTLISFKVLKTFDLRPLSARLAGIPKISIHSLQEYCWLAQHLLSIVTILSDSLVYTFQVTYILVPRV